MTAEKDSSNPYAMKRWQWTLTFLVGFGFLWLAGFGLFLEYVRSMQPQDPTQPTDAIIVLTGGAQRDHRGEPLHHGEQRRSLNSENQGYAEHALSLIHISEPTRPY